VHAWVSTDDPGPRCIRHAVADLLRNPFRARNQQGAQMNPIYWFAALIAVALSVYLLVALLKPEWFE